MTDADSRFHAGELRAQDLAGESARAAQIVRMVEGRIPAARLGFLEQVRLLAVAAEGAWGGPQATILDGEPGFVRSPDAHSIVIAADAVDGLSLVGRLEAGAPVGLLAIDPPTRSRLRANGTVHGWEGQLLHLAVAEGFPNCGKYIRHRTYTGGQAPVANVPPTLDVILRRADTLVLATAHRERGMDVSHKAGTPGRFVAFDAAAGTLRLPDFAGNSLFNSFGNLLVDAHAAVAVADFAAGVQARLHGTAAVAYGDEDADGRTGGTGRFLEFRIAGHDIVPLGRPGSWADLDESPGSTSG